MSLSNVFNSFGNNTVVLFLILAIFSAYLGHAIGRGDKEDYLQQQKQQQKNEHQIDQRK